MPRAVKLLHCKFPMVNDILGKTGCSVQTSSACPSTTLCTCCTHTLVLVVQCLMRMQASLAQQDELVAAPTPLPLFTLSTRQRERVREDVTAIKTATISGRASAVVSYQIKIVARATRITTIAKIHYFLRKSLQIHWKLQKPIVEGNLILNHHYNQLVMAQLQVLSSPHFLDKKSK